MSIEVEIDRGRVRVNEIRHVINRPDVHVFEVDLASKYPGQPQWMENAAGNGMDVYLLHISRTRDLDDQATADTLIQFVGFADGPWTGVAEATGYTARIVFYRRPVD